MTVAEALRAAEAQLREASESPRLDAEVLLGHVLGWPRGLLLTNEQHLVDQPRGTHLSDLVKRRALGEPVAYLIGLKEFWSLPLKVTRDVLVPRPETETLVEWALDLVVNKPAPRIADLGTGSGAIALAIASERPDAQVFATDVSREALAVARDNAAQLKIANVRFAQGSWFQPLAGESFDLIVSNPPYVAAGDQHLAQLHSEPDIALVAGPDGLEAIRAIAEGAAACLGPDGWLILEHGAEQGAAVREILQGRGWREVETRQDLADLDRVTAGRKP